jgi:uncharacterized protein (DUF2141 family)
MLNYLLILWLVGWGGYHPKSSDLVIEITNIEQTKGTIKIGIYDKADLFPKDNGAAFSQVCEVNSKTLSCTIKNLPHGVYAIALYHDVNEDNVCNMNIVGMPKEPYGFSNNIKPVFSAPSFETTKFLHNRPMQISIALQK